MRRIKCLLLESCDSLTGNFQEIPSETLSSLFGVEGPECYLLPDQKTWCLIADQFAEGKGYLPLLTDDLSSGKFRILKEKDMLLEKQKNATVAFLQLLTRSLPCWNDFLITKSRS